jgi:tetraacyldisaccharide 4'-kinase
LSSIQQAYLRFIHDRRKDLVGEAVFLVLKGLSWLFLAGWWTRRAAFAVRLLRRRRLPCPVVSVGNLTTGGTGKTPLVIELARSFVKAGKRVAVLSRGYKGRRPGSRPLWVSDGRKVLAGPAEAGDEPVLIARKVPEAAVLVHPVRYQAGMEAVAGFKPDVIVLDDGFQRRFSLHRDLDLLVVDALNPFSSGWPLPAGLLREPLSALSEAGVFVVNKADQAANLEDIRTVLKARNPRAFVVESRYEPALLRDLTTGKRMNPSHLDGSPVGALSGLATPLYFVRTLAAHKVIVRHAYTFDDHYAYTAEELREVARDAQRRGLEYLVTTEKDEVKFPAGLELPVPVLVLEIEWRITRGREHWDTVMRGLQLAAGA